MTEPAPGVHAVDEVRLRLAPEPSGFQDRYAPEIARHWARETARNPALFNGTIHMSSQVRIAEGTLEATCHPVRFAALLYWRDHRATLPPLRNTFGDAILRGADGALLMGRMGPTTSHEGVVKFPGGGFDPRDVRDGALDAAHCVARECAEETGLDTAAYTPRPGFLVYLDEMRVAVAQVLDLPGPATAAAARIGAFIAAETAPELSEVVVVRDSADLARLAPIGFARALATHVLAGT